MQSMNELNRLFDAYAENDLSAADEAALSAWLRERPEHVDKFVRETFLHSELFSFARQQFLHENVLRHRLNDDAARTIAKTELLTVNGPSKDAASRRLHPWMLAAAMLFIAIALGAWSAVSPSVVGQLTQVTADAVWQHQSEVLKAGEFLHEGQRLHLVRGRALLTLGSGARVVVAAPARLHLVDDNRVGLTAGRVGATVPTQAIGFTVETASGDFVDLGTEFTVDLQSDGKCRLFVFTGMVEMRPKSPGRVSRPFQIPQTKAVTYDPVTDVADPLPIGEEVKLAL
jgi:hypothetical protein